MLRSILVGFVYLYTENNTGYYSSFIDLPFVRGTLSTEEKMSYLGAGHSSDVEQDKLTSDFRGLNRSNTNLATKSKFADVLWNHKDDSDSEISDSGNFLAKGKADLYPAISILPLLLLGFSTFFQIVFSLLFPATVYCEIYFFKKKIPKQISKQKLCVCLRPQVHFC